ncbi:CesT family type III secretion system chaperone [Mitsuaria sp. 7]|uniref:CesT family type III secretion system chaperone n=1 Tax=Mitsuaria sp. 7 TaxID=1658665 RepID=UPI0007DD9C49|nr:CesT family type III secretion system chaperone [Mitsuaria sp. 7]ANH67371.1 hypothetical protein ABE85_06920 [Mitsuaria sp. 7]
MLDPQEADTRFAQLLAALSRRTATPLEARDGLLVLIDSDEAVQLVVELASPGDRVVIVARVMSVPQEDPAGTLALRLLRLNADREALDGVVIAADGLRQFVLIRELPLDQEAETLADAVEALLELAALVRAEAPVDRVRGPRTATLLRANGSAR